MRLPMSFFLYGIVTLPVSVDHTLVDPRVHVVEDRELRVAVHLTDDVVCDTARRADRAILRRRRRRRTTSSAIDHPHRRNLAFIAENLRPPSRPQLALPIITTHHRAKAVPRGSPEIAWFPRMSPQFGCLFDHSGDRVPGVQPGFTGFRGSRVHEVQGSGFTRFRAQGFAGSRVLEVLALQSITIVTTPTPISRSWRNGPPSRPPRCRSGIRSAIAT